MSIISKTIFDEFEVRGSWWLFDKPDRRLPGRLKFSQTRIDLELDGRFKDSNDSDDDDSLRGVTLFGIGTGGEAYSLLDCFESGYNITFGFGHQISSFIANRVIAGEHIANLADLSVSSASLYLHGLTESFDRFQRDMAGDGTSYLVEVTKPAAFAVHVPSIATKISVDMLTGPALTQRAISISPEAFILIKSDKAIPFSELRATISSLSDFFTILGCYPAPVLRIGTGSAEKNSVFSVFTRQTCSVCPPLPGLDDLLVRFSDLAPEVRSDVLTRWFGLDAQARLAQHWTTTIMSTPTPFNQLDFVHLSHGLESLHSSFCGSKYMPKQEFKAVVEAMCAAIPDTVSEDHRIKLTNQVRYGNEYNLRTRLKELISRLPESLRSYMIVDIDRFAGAVVATRNANTHLSAEEEKMVISDDLLSAANDGLKLLFCLSLLNHIGIPESVLAAGLTRSNVYRSFSYRRPW